MIIEFQYATHLIQEKLRQLLKQRPICCLDPDGHALKVTGAGVGTHFLDHLRVLDGGSVSKDYLVTSPTGYALRVTQLIGVYQMWALTLELLNGKPAPAGMPYHTISMHFDF